MTSTGTLISSVDGERRFFTLVTAAIAIVVLIGFARTFFLRAMFPEAQSFAAPERIFPSTGSSSAPGSDFLSFRHFSFEFGA